MDNTKVKRLDSSPEISASRVKHILHSKIFIEAEVSALFELLMEMGMLSLWLSRLTQGTETMLQYTLC